MSLPLEIVNAYAANRTCVDKSVLCHAPEAAMYFGRDGCVSACCYSRNQAFGSYPEQSVEQLWQSANAATMRAGLRRGELPQGCELCADELLAENFSGLLARQYDALASKPTPWEKLQSRLGLTRSQAKMPKQMDFELSNKCNLECVMCSGFFSSSIRANRENLPPLPQQYGPEFVQELEPFLPHLKCAKFLGGEPFLIDIYYAIWERLMEVNPDCDVSITTNATVMTDRVKRVLEKLRCRIIVSLDSVVPETYEAIRRNASYDRTMANFAAYCEHNRRHGWGLTIAVCPMPLNAEEMPGLVRFATDRGVRVTFNNLVFPAEHSLKSLPEAKLRELLTLYREHGPQEPGEVAEANRTSLEGLCSQIEFWIEERGTAAGDALAERCGKLLADPSTPQRLQPILRDLQGPAAEGLVSVEMLADPIETLASYYEAIWEVGAVLRSEGVLETGDFDGQEGAKVVRYLRSISPQRATRVYKEARRFPRYLLAMAGTAPADRMIQAVEEHFGVGTAGGQP